MAPLRILLVLLLALASSTQPCRAQLLGPCGPAEADYVYQICMAHLTMPAVTQPDYNCCEGLNSRRPYYSASCYCDIYNLWKANPGTIDMNRAYALPKACNVADVNMTTCAAPNPVAPPSPDPSLSPPPPPGFSFPSPPDAVAPPGSTSSVPGGSVSTSESSGKSSSAPLALPLGITGGVVGLIIVVLALIVRLNLRYNLNDPCSCCNRRKPQPQAHDVHGDKVPAKYGI